MYTDYYELNEDPFRLTPDYRFVYPHESYSKVQASMRHALDQGEGILVVTGRAGTGKTTLVEHFLAGMGSDSVPTAKLVSTQLENDDLLRMVAYAFAIKGKNQNKARLLRDLQSFLEKHPRAVLVIDEAQNLPESSLEELRMLTNLHAGPRPLLQVFLVGQEKLKERLHHPELEQFQQRLTALCEMRPLNLEDTFRFVLYRLACVNWRGSPAIATDTFPLIHRCTQGLPRYICKLGSRLLLHCAHQQQSTVALEDVATVALEMHNELLLPLTADGAHDAVDPLPDIEAILRLQDAPTEQRMFLSVDEQALLASQPEYITKAPEGVTPPSDPVDNRDHGATHKLSDQSGLRPLTARVPGWFSHNYRNRYIGYGAAAVVLLTSAYQLGVQRAPREMATPEQLSVRQIDTPVAAPPVPLETFTLGASPAAASDDTGAERPGVLYDVSATDTAPITLLAPGDYSSSAAIPMAADSGFRLMPAIEPVEIIEPESAVPAPSPAVSGEKPAPSPATVAPGPEDLAPTDSGQRPAAGLATVGSEAKAVVSPERNELQELLHLADQAISRDRLLTPRRQSAWHYYQEVFLLDPNNQQAMTGLQRIADRYAELAALVLDRQQYDRAREFVDRGLTVAASDEQLLALHQSIDIREAEAAKSEKAALAESEPEPSGLFGRLKRFFSGN